MQDQLQRLGSLLLDSYKEQLSLLSAQDSSPLLAALKTEYDTRRQLVIAPFVER